MLPSGYSSRPARADDLDAVTALVERAQLHDIGRMEYTLADVESDWRRLGFTPELEAVVVEGPEEGCVAYAQVLPRGTERYYGWGDVEPNHRKRGLGAFLVQWLEIRARAPDRPVVLAILAESRASHAKALLEQRGFREARRFWTMERVLDGSEHLSEAPSGVEIRTVDAEREMEEVHAVLQDAFREHYGFVARPFEEAIGQTRADPRFDPSLWFVATDGGRIVGALVATAFDDEGWVDTLGVLGAWRGKGIAKSLLQRSFATFAERGAPVVALSVDAENVTGAVRLYESVGMSVRIAYDHHEKTVQPSP